MNVFSFFGFLSCFLFEISVSYLSLFLILSYVCCSTSLFLVSKNPSSKTPIFGQKGDCNINGFFFINLCFAKCEKLSFGGGGLAIFWLLFKKHYKNRHLSTFFKAKNYKKTGILKCYYLVQVKCYYLVQVGCVLKSVNLEQIITFKILARNFCLQKKRVETPIFIVLFDNQCFIKSKLGPDNNI